jgi:F420-0:gamma-glutamyl ligase
VFWPRNPDLSAGSIRRSIQRRSGKNVGVIIVDSRVSPLRLGTTGFAIGSAGFEPVEDLRGTVDLFGRRIEITLRAIADGIASSAQLVMGEASDRIPFAIIRDAPVKFGGRHGIRSAKIAWNRCLYMSQIPVPIALDARDAKVGDGSELTKGNSHSAHTQAIPFESRQAQNKPYSRIRAGGL